MRYTVPNDDKPRTIPVGRVGENDWTELAFDVREWLEEIPGAVVAVAYQRAGDANAYPLPATVEDGVAVVKLTAAETAKAGLGKIQLTITNAAGVVAKSRIYSTACLASLDGSGEPPEEWRPFIDEVFAAAVRAETAAAAAEADAEAIGNRIIGGIKRYHVEDDGEFSFTSADDGEGYFAGEVIYSMIASDLYRVTFDGTPYIVAPVVCPTPWTEEETTGMNYVVLGNLEIVNLNIHGVKSPNNLPFGMTRADNGKIYTAEPGEHTIRFERIIIDELDELSPALFGAAVNFPIYVHASGNRQSISVGFNRITGKYCYALGEASEIDGNGNVSLGILHRLSGFNNVALGAKNTATGNYGVVGGYRCSTSYFGAVCLGYDSVAGEGHSIVLGRLNKTEALYSAAIAGNSNTAKGSGAAILGGRQAIAEHDDAFIAGGRYNRTGANGQAVVGYANAPAEDDVFEVGNGINADGEPALTADEPATRQNALAVKRDGTVVAQRAFKIGDYEIDEDKLARLLALIS